MNMNRTFAAVAALSILGSTAAWAQSQPPTMEKPPAQSMKPEVKEIQGTIQSVDRTKKTVTLEDGITLAIPASMRVAPDALTKGRRLARHMKRRADRGWSHRSISCRPPSRNPRAGWCDGSEDALRTVRPLQGLWGGVACV